MSETETEPVGEAVPATKTEDKPAPAAEKPPADKSFSQADVDRFMARQRREMLGDAGDLATLKQKAEQFDKLDSERKSELEKANEKIAKLERQSAEAAQAAQASLLRAAVVGEAAKRNVVDPDAALALLDRAKLEFGEDGAPTNVAEAMESLLKDKPYLVAGGRQGGRADLGAREGGVEKQITSHEQVKAMSSEERLKAYREGRMKSLLESGG